MMHEEVQYRLRTIPALPVWIVGLAFAIVSFAAREIASKLGTAAVRIRGRSW